MDRQNVYDDGDALLKKLSLDKSSIDVWRDGLVNKWFRLNTLYDITDVKGNHIPFKPNDAQRDLFIHGHTRNVILKARQLGFTTFKMIDELDNCLFIDNYKAACIAHSLEAVKEIFDEKIKFCYEHINHGLISHITGGKFKLPIPSVDRANAYKFSNGSKFSVGTGYRSGTLQSLHVSEFGKICKKRPDVAKEIVSGSFEAVSEEGVITVESTAEGREGKFFDICQIAKNKTEFGRLDFKLRFYPWHENPRYEIEDGSINPRLIPYFDELLAKHGIELSDGQKRWYSVKEESLGEDIYREHPSYPDEAFKVAIEGAYYARQFAEIYKERRIGTALNDKHTSVRTAWDIGTSDSTAIWFYEVVGNEIHLIDYYENSGHGLAHYLRVIEGKPYEYDRHYGPHDMRHRQFSNNAKTLQEIAKEGVTCDEDKGTADEGKVYKLSFEIVPQSPIMGGIEIARSTLQRCYFYKEETERGVTCLENYRKEWDKRNGCWKDNPLHDWSSHGADAFRYLGNAENKRERASAYIGSLR